jgi:hypothetical protein
VDSEKVAHQLSKQKFQGQVYLVRLQQVADVVVKERRVLNSDITIFILNAQTSEIEERFFIDAEVLFELNQGFFFHLFVELFLMRRQK